MQMGGICIGCTMPGFPDKFSPFYAAPPGSFLSSSASRVMGGFIRRMRRITLDDKNRSPRWDKETPSGWARYDSPPSAAAKLTTRFYRAYQRSKQSYE
jgi:hydrogenase small subunit